MQDQALDLRVWSRRAEALDVVSIELRHPQGRSLPRFTPGAHIEILVPNLDLGRPYVRQYSLCNDSTEVDRYVIAVGRNENGRGGSISTHELIAKGMSLECRGPRNHFGFTDSAASYRFIAGGIGITPILSMLRWCERNGKPWKLLYCTRGRHRTPFYEELRSYGEKVQFHFSDEHRQLADIGHALVDPQINEHIYCCGPTGLMQEVEMHSKKWPNGCVHFEWFVAPQVDKEESQNNYFEIVLHRSARRLTVPANKSILECLESNGIEVPYSCREGLCRTCEIPILAGEADHCDYVLSEEERRDQKSLLICVSRAKTKILELDL